MPTTAEYLQRLVQAKSDIATAITNKGGTVSSGDGFEDFPNCINTINTAVINPLNVIANGTYTAPLFVDGYNPVVVNVPNSYSAGDEGKVVSNGTLVAQTSRTVTTNNTTYDTTLNNSVTVDIAIPQPTLITKSITTNGTYNASSDSADGYSSVDVDVANTYTNADEGKVVNNNALVSQTSASDSNINVNGTYTYDTTYNNSKKVIVAVPNTYTSGDEGKVVSNGALTAQTSTTKTVNGTYDTTLNNEVVIAVPNTYTASDEGKVVNQGALVSQTSTSITTNNTTVDTTLNNSVTVNVPVPQPTLITKSITSNGTYNASSDSADGYSSVSVAVPNTYSVSDEGKVVSNGALVSQTSTTITTNNTTVDTTLINSVNVQVPASTFPYPSIALYATATSTDVAPTWYMTITKAQTSNTSLHKIYWSVSGVISSGYGQKVARYPIGFNLSDYFTQDETMTIVGVKRGYSSTVNITVTIKLATNTVEFGTFTFPATGSGALYCFNYKQLDAKIYN